MNNKDLNQAAFLNTGLSKPLVIAAGIPKLVICDLLENLATGTELTCTLSVESNKKEHQVFRNLVGWGHE